MGGRQIFYNLTMAILLFSNSLQADPGLTHDRTFSSATIQVLPRVTFQQPVPGMDAEHILMVHPQQNGLTTTHHILQALEQTRLHDVRYERCGVKRAGNVYPNAPTPGYSGGWQRILDRLAEDPNYYQQFNYISGHNLKIGMHLPEYANLPNAKYITLIRNPLGVDGHILSTANFALMQNYITRAEYDAYIKTFIDNPYTRMLAGDDLTGECTEETLNRAIANLQQHFLLVGVTEETDLFMSVLASMRGWPNIAVARFHVADPDYKVYKAEAEIPADLREHIRRNNEFDLRLYEFAKEYWAQWKSKYIASTYTPGLDEEVLCLPPEYPLDRIPYILKVRDVAAQHNAMVADANKLVETKQIWHEELAVGSKLPTPKY